MMTEIDTTGWLRASNGVSVHRPIEATKDSPFPAGVCGRRGLSRVRTTKAHQDGSPVRPCKRCVSMGPR